MTDNERIAKFMGEPLTYIHCTYLETTERKINYENYYHEWANLMEVVQKISKLHDSSFEYDVDKIRNGDWPKDNEYMEVIALPLSTPIEDVHKAVLEFIKWFETREGAEECTDK